MDTSARASACLTLLGIPIPEKFQCCEKLQIPSEFIVDYFHRMYDWSKKFNIEKTRNYSHISKILEDTFRVVNEIPYQDQDHDIPIYILSHIKSVETVFPDAIVDWRFPCNSLLHFSKRKEIIKALIEIGANPQATNALGEIPNQEKIKEALL